MKILNSNHLQLWHHLKLIRVLEKYRVSPPPMSVAEPPTVPLTSFDIIWLHATPVERIFFYPFPHSTASFIHSHLPNLKFSLSLTLQAFYTLAGNIRRTPDSDDRYEIYYTEGDAVAFTVVESRDDFHHLSSGGMRDFSKIHPLVPRLSAVSGAITTSLLAVQATMFPDHGICIGITIHHAAGDGSSTTRFLKTWASACRSGELDSLPIYERDVVREPSGHYLLQYNRMMQMRAIRAAEEKLDLAKGATPVFASFMLRLADIQGLKQRVAASAAGPVHCSTFVVSCAHVWVCLVRARRHASHKSAHFLFAVDCRSRLDPPVPNAYFGNCSRPCFADADIKELIGGDGVVTASAAIGKAIEGLNDRVMRGAEEWLVNIISMPERPVSVAGSPKFRVYDIDFGWGRPQSVEIPSIMKTGTISIAEARENDGGVEIGLGLEKHEIDEFETHFYRCLHFQQDGF